MHSWRSSSRKTNFPPSLSYLGRRDVRSAQYDGANACTRTPSPSKSEQFHQNTECVQCCALHASITRATARVRDSLAWPGRQARPMVEHSHPLVAIGGRPVGPLWCQSRECGSVFYCQHKAAAPPRPQQAQHAVSRLRCVWTLATRSLASVAGFLC